MIDEAVILQGMLVDSIMHTTVSFVIGLLGLLFLAHILKKIYPASRDYRKLLGDMFVAARIRQVADESKIDLDAEMEKFARFMKIKSIDCEAIDESIERDLQEKLNEKLDKAVLRPVLKEKKKRK